jgi:hypothetical protein
MRALWKTKTRVCLALLFCSVATGVAGCGGDDFANEPRPADAIELTGVIQTRGVTVSPSKGVGAGPILLTISNQTDDAHTVTLEGESVEERVGPIQPQDTATIQKTLEPGRYQVRAGSEQAVKREIPPASLTVGAERPSSSNKVLLP